MADPLEELPERLTPTVLNNVLDQLKAHWKGVTAEGSKRSRSTLTTCRKLTVTINGSRTPHSVRLEQLVSFIYITARENYQVSSPSKKQDIQYVYQ